MFMKLTLVTVTYVTMSVHHPVRNEKMHLDPHILPKKGKKCSVCMTVPLNVCSWIHLSFFHFPNSPPIYLKGSNLEMTKYLKDEV